MISSARQFFDRLIAGGASAIEQMVADQQHEQEWLDFKSGEFLSEEKRTWSEAICGFANNQGGVLVWGIDARKDPATGVDAACAVKPVDNPPGLRTRLLELLRNAVEPPVPGVEVREVFRSGKAGAGFVICFIPESESKPHRAEFVSGKPYIIRIADGFQNPSPSLLRSLFYPKSSPALGAFAVPEWDEDASTRAGNPIPVRFRLTLRNIGIVTAKDIYVVVAARPFGMEASAPFRVRVHPHGIENHFELERACHPTSSNQFCTLNFQAAPAECITQQGRSVRPSLRLFEARIDVYAADMMPLRLGVALGDMDIHLRNGRTAMARLDSEPLDFSDCV